MIQIPTDISSWPPHEAQEWLMDQGSDEDVTDAELESAHQIVRGMLHGRTQQWAYLVERTDTRAESDRRALRYGIRELAEGWDLSRFACRLASETRVEHPYGHPVRVHLWRHVSGQLHPSVRRGTPPANAKTYVNPDIFDS